MQIEATSRVDQGTDIIENNANMVWCSSHQRGVPSAPVILYRRTEITASPSGNSGLPTDKERGSVSDNGDSSDTSDEIDPVSSKRYDTG